MPPKAKYTKEEIIERAMALVREEGYKGLTARSLAKAMGTSACPIFTLFHGMEEVQACVFERATALYDGYIQAAMTGGEYPPYKASGMAYIRFAREEKELFKLLFMRDRTGENIEDGRESLRPILEVIRANLGGSEEEAYAFHMQIWIYVHGIATMLATSYLEWSEEYISVALSDAYAGLKIRYLEKIAKR